MNPDTVDRIVMWVAVSLFAAILIVALSGCATEGCHSDQRTVNHAGIKNICIVEV